MKIKSCILILTLALPAGLLPAQPGHVGINTTTPSAPLHVVWNIPSPGPKHSHVMGIFESQDEAFLQLSNQENMTTGILSGDRWTAIRSGLIFAGDSSMVFKSGGDFARMILDQNGAVGINMMNPKAGLHVHDKGVVFTGQYPLPLSIAPPVSGAGTRMMWYPEKAAFRSGAVAADQWDENNIGKYSMASGFGNTAKGQYSFSGGVNSSATGVASVAMGHYAEAKGDYTVAMGLTTMAKSFGSFVIGHYNDTTSISGNAGYQEDPLFIIGNGSNIYARKNAMTVLRNGNTGINTPSPQSPLHVKRWSGSGGPYFNYAMATFESGDQSYIHLSHPNAFESGILSGNQSTIIRSGLVFGIDSSMLFRSGGNVTRMKLNPSGYLGINTTSPRSYLHIRRSGFSMGPIHPLTYALFESNSNGYVQFSNTAGTESGLLSGNDDTSIRSAVIFTADSSVILRSGGNIDRLFIRPSGYVGVNMSSPQRMFHIRESAASGAVLHEDAVVVIEKNDAAFVQLISSGTGTSGLCASDPSSTVRGSIEFLPDLSMRFVAGGGLGIHIDQDGDVGLGTSTPDAQLDVSGSFKLGGSGSVLYGIYQESVQHDIPNLAAGSSYMAHFSFVPASSGATAFISPGYDLPDGLVIAYVRCVNGEVHAKFTNVSSAAINPPQYTYHISVIK